MYSMQALRFIRGKGALLGLVGHNSILSEFMC